MSAHNLFASLPNLISLGRLILVPVVIVLILQPAWGAAFVVFLVAGVSDAVDGWLAKRFNLRSELGSYLDPLADKALLMSIYISLAAVGVLPAAIAIIVVARDLMIMGAVMVSWVMDKPVVIRPLLVSKLNTLVQIALATAVLFAKAAQWELGLWFVAMLYLVATLTLASAAAYLTQWLRHMDIY
ncbi:MAG: CDP-alcohol phosphatidyltransferase [Hyphomicrobiales bacterium]|nr:CDP-alcohol phosphatidyltransferase [Hyphomicrobiales bacterium]